MAEEVVRRVLAVASGAGARVPCLGSRPHLCQPVALVAEDDGGGGLLDSLAATASRHTQLNLLWRPVLLSPL
eukprot:333777-Prymnesium_polylepis.1